MKVIIYSRVSSNTQDNERQIINLKDDAQTRGWHVQRVFQEKISGTTKTESRTGLKSLMDYLKNKHVDIVMVSEISRIGRTVVDVLNFVEMLHGKGIALYIQPFKMLTYENNEVNSIAKMLLQMLSIGAEMENNQRKTRQKEGIKLAQLKGIYTGRKEGAKASPEKVISKYKDIADLLDKSELSVRRIATITNHSINTVRKVKKLKEA